MGRLLLLLALAAAVPLAWLASGRIVPGTTPTGSGLAPRDASPPPAASSLDATGRFEPLPMAAGSVPATSGARYGVLRTADGVLRIGSFVRAPDGSWVLHGDGRWRSPTGAQHDGGFAQGVRSGVGVTLTATGAVLAGAWAADRLTGIGHRIDVGGQRFSGSFEGGEADGRGWCFEQSTVRSCQAAEAVRN